MPFKDPEKQREYARQWIARRKAEFFAGKSCAACGSVENLELDHIDPDSKVNHRIWSWSEKRRNEELAKCQVLCFDCHVKKTRMNGESQRNSRGSSQYVGVSFDRSTRSRKKWQSKIRIGEKYIFIGRFLTEIEAAKQRRHMTRRLVRFMASLLIRISQTARAV